MNVQKIVGITMIIVCSVIIHYYPLNIPSAVLGMIWGWDITFRSKSGGE